MGHNKTQIRSLPRTGEAVSKKSPPGAESKRAPDTEAESDKESKKTPRWIIYVGSCSVLFLAALFILPKNSANRVVHSVPKAAAVKVASKPVPRDVSSVDRYLAEAQLKQQILQHQRELENMQLQDDSHKRSPDDYLALPDSDANLGVQFEGDKAAENVFEDLNDTVEQNARDNAELSPEERINLKLSKTKFVNEHERQERIDVVTKFVRDAYDRGLEVEIDQNLVVVGVRKIDTTRKLNINQVIDRIAKMGL